MGWGERRGQAPDQPSGKPVRRANAPLLTQAASDRGSRRLHLLQDARGRSTLGALAPRDCLQGSQALAGPSSNLASLPSPRERENGIFALFLRVWR